MPYIPREVRLDLLRTNRHPDNAGELNYLITIMVDDYIIRQGMSYKTLNEVIGVLECAKQELYSRIVARYKNGKIGDNGDVYECFDRYLSDLQEKGDGHAEGS